ncbi:nucleoid occlusion protein [Erysipelatoclostridium sp. AM42-17]|uniref:nucleoid occlusion protein n=1 Tax=Erysipelatoclostridium sp. AM42-17 TaxID=2293102 RepID=UPI000E4DF452|nr:nucleoid occlusion protein [Erysipelatoclostridium sp. AM42-17]RHS95877.1 nucleoid occlusion protein [Erysipelatoclostridium sp. AM42-17]
MLEKVYKLIDIKKIYANENQPRKVFNDEKIEELSTSIKENGLIQPIVVRKTKEGYQIIAGERRFRACKLADMTKVPCIIKEYDDKQVETLSVIENIQREDLSPLEEAKAYKSLLDTYQYSQQELAKVVGKKQSTIANKLRLLKLSDGVKDALDNRTITERHARAMVGLDQEKQETVLKEVIQKHLNVAQTEKFIDKKPKPKKVRPKKAVSQNVKIALNTIKQATSMIEKSGVTLVQEVADEEDQYIITIKINK